MQAEDLAQEKKEMHVPPPVVLSPSSVKRMVVDGDLNTGTYTRVHLRVRAPVALGEQLHCSGSSFSMGQYNPNESTALFTSPDEYPIWKTLKPLILPRGVPHHYMFAVFSGGQFDKWEAIECDRIIIPEGLEMTIEEEYGLSDETMILENVDDKTSRSVVYRRVQDSDAQSSEDKEITRSSSQHFPLNKHQVSGYKRFQSSNFKPEPDTTLMIVSYHLPVLIEREAVGFKIQWDLDTIMAKTEGSVADSLKVHWIGCLTHHAYPRVAELTQDDWHEIVQQLALMNCSVIRLDPEIEQHFYLGYCKNTLWPMFHNVDILDLCSAVWEKKSVQGTDEFATGKWWTAYKRANQVFAEKVFQTTKPGDTVFIHDYHFFLLASNIEKLCKIAERPAPKMIFFLHIPFPTSEIFRELSNGPELLEGVLSVDVVGFHSFDHARHFLNACKRFLGLSYQSRRGGNLGVDFHGRNVIVTISHIGIETQYLSTGLADPIVAENALALQDKYKGKILICGIDIMERLSGVPLKLLAFEQLIELYPVWKDKVVLVQRCIRGGSRPGDESHSAQENKQLVQRITSKHGAVIDYEECDSMELKDRLALYLSCGIMFHTPIRGGLNRRPLEYAFAREKNPGVTLLSEFSACCCVMNGAIRINPWNMSENTTILDQALVMSKEERDGRRARDLGYITQKTAASWTRQVMTVLQEAMEDPDEEYTDMEYTDMEIGGSHVLRIGERTDFVQLDPSKLLNAYKSTQRRIFLVDYGGTIIVRENMSMYVKKDFTAVSGRSPSSRMMTALAKLCANPLNTVFIISGVSQVNLTSALGHIQGLSLAAQSGVLWSFAQQMKETEVNGEVVGGREICSALETLNEESASKRQWEQQKNLSYDWNQIRSVADPILKAFRSRTNGSIIQQMEQGIAWNYRSTDPEWGLMQANQLQTDLHEVLKDFPVMIVRKKGLLEIVPEGLHKGAVARKILATESAKKGRHPDFIFCIGDDTTDESMFKAIYEYIAERSEDSVHGMDGGMSLTDQSIQHVFTCTVGKKPSNAHLYVNAVQDVEDLMSLLGEESADEVTTTSQ